MAELSNPQAVSTNDGAVLTVESDTPSGVAYVLTKSVPFTGSDSNIADEIRAGGTPVAGALNMTHTTTGQPPGTDFHYGWVQEFAPESTTLTSVDVIDFDTLQVNFTEATDADRYEIERSPNGVDGWVVVGDVPVFVYTDNGLLPDTEYYYRVTPIAASGTRGPVSNVGMGITSPVTASNYTLDVSAETDTASWTHPDFNVINSTARVVSGNLGAGEIGGATKVVLTSATPSGSDTLTVRITLGINPAEWSDALGPALLVPSGPDIGKGYWLRHNGTEIRLWKTDALNSLGSELPIWDFTPITPVVGMTIELQMTVGGDFTARVDGVPNGSSNSFTDYIGEVVPAFMEDWGSMGQRGFTELYITGLTGVVRASLDGLWGFINFNDYAVDTDVKNTPLYKPSDTPGSLIRNTPPLLGGTQQYVTDVIDTDIWGDDSPQYGAWGVGASLAGTGVEGEGDEVWARAWVRINPDWTWNYPRLNYGGPPADKFLRFRLTNNDGWNDIYYKFTDGTWWHAVEGLYNGPDNPAGGTGWWQVGSGALVPGQWHCIETYEKFSVDPQIADCRMWFEGAPIGVVDYTSYGSTGNILDGAGPLTNWELTPVWRQDKGVSPNPQQFHYGSIAIAVKSATRDDTPNLSRDSSGFPFIGTDLT